MRGERYTWTFGQNNTSKFKVGLLGACGSVATWLPDTWSRVNCINILCCSYVTQPHWDGTCGLWEYIMLHIQGVCRFQMKA